MPPVQAKIQIAIWKVRTGPTSFGQRGLLLILPFFFQFRLHGVSDCIIVHNQLPATQFQINPTDNGQRTTDNGQRDLHIKSFPGNTIEISALYKSSTIETCKIHLMNYYS
jgi:hypothetical protein